MVRARIRCECDLGNAELGRRTIHRSSLNAHVGDVGLQQMRSDTAYLFREGAGGLADGAAREHDRSGSKRAKSVWPHRRITVANGNPCWIDPQLMRGDLRKRCLMPLAMILHAHVNQNATVREHAHIRGFVTRDHAKLPFDEFHRPVAALLGVKRKADANPATVRLARCLSFADGRKIDFLASDIERGNIVSSIKLQTRRRLVRKLSCGDGILPSQIEWLTVEFARNLVDQAFKCESCS